MVVSMPVFERPHHRRIAHVLETFDAQKLQQYACWFGGGTAITLRRNEFRESLDMDFLVANEAGYRALRLLLLESDTMKPITRAGHTPVSLARPFRADQYGIRTFIRVDDVELKFEIVREARITFDLPSPRDRVCGVYALTPVDLAASKFLANSDRFADAGTFARDIIDLAMLDLPPRKLEPALRKAEVAYGRAALADANRALDRLRTHPDTLRRCMDALSITLPPAIVQQRLRSLSRRFAVIARARRDAT